MKTLGLLGGMTWNSTSLYYTHINKRIAQRLGGLHSSKIVMYSFDFAELERFQKEGNWEEASRFIAKPAVHLKDSGAEGILICANTFHIIADSISEATKLPVLHVADFTARAIKAKGYRKDFYKSRLTQKHGLSVIIPYAESRTVVHDIIYDELCKGIVTESSREKYVDVIKELVEEGAECVILGCTEIVMLIGQGDSSVDVFDTTLLHAEGAADWALDSP